MAHSAKRSVALVYLRTYQIAIKIIVVNTIMPPNMEPMTIPAISPLASPSEPDSVSVTVGMSVVDDREGVIDDVIIIAATQNNECIINTRLFRNICTHKCK